MSGADGSVEGLFGNEETIGLPERALETLSEMRALMAAVFQMARDETKAATDRGNRAQTPCHIWIGRKPSAMAEEFRAKNPFISFAEAFARVGEANPELMQRDRKERYQRMGLNV